MSITPWILKESHHNDAQIRLFCFPYSGGGASIWRGWHEALAPYINVVSVQLPGRENRIKEPPAQSFDELLGPLQSLIQGYTDIPFALLGHSMGAHLAFALTDHFNRIGVALPSHLIISGRRPVHLPAPPKVSILSDKDLADTIRARQGSSALYDDLLEMMLPTIRADLQSTEHWPAPPPTKFPVHLTTMGGTDDPWADAEQLTHWYDYFPQRQTPKIFPGDHFFIHQHTAEIQDYIKKTLLTPPGQSFQ